MNDLKNDNFIEIMPAGPTILDRSFEKTIILCITVTALYIGQSIFIPLALAILLTFLLAQFVTKLRQLRVPKGFSVAIVTIAAFSLLIFLGFSIGRQVTLFAEELPRYKFTLVDKIQTLKSFAATGPVMERAGETLRSLRKEIDTTAPSETPPVIDSTRAPQKVEIEERATPLAQLRQTIDVLAPPLVFIGIVIIFVVVLLLYREDVRDRAIRILGVHDLARTTRALDDAGQRLNRYFLAITFINATFGLVIGSGLWLIGVPNPLLWALFSFLLRFVPFIGVPIAAILPLLLSIVVDPGWSMLAYTAALFIISELFISQVVETIVHGEATGLSPLAIIIATTFWTLLWGPVGLILAVPLTVMLVVLGNHAEQFAIFNILLGAAPALTPSDRFYQRILADDPEEAADQAESQLKEKTLLDYYDSVVLDGLKKAASDIESGKLDATRAVRFKESLNTFIETALELDREIRDPKKTTSTDIIISQSPIICIGARTKLDDVAAAMLAQVLQTREISSDFMTTAELFDDPKADPKTICLSTFDIAASGAYTKFLVKRLHRRFPNARFIGCFWRVDLANDQRTSMIPHLENDEIINSLKSAVDLCQLHLQSVNNPTPPKQVVI